MILGQVVPVPHIVFVIAVVKAKQSKTKQKAGKPCTAHLTGTEVDYPMRGVL